MQRFVAVLAFTLSTAAPAFAAVVSADQRTAPAAADAAAPEARAFTPPAQQTPQPPVVMGQTVYPGGTAPQAPAPPATTAPVATASSSRAPSLPVAALAVNIKLDLVLTDNFAGAPAKKTVSMVVMNRQNGMIRTQNNIGGHQVRLDVDAAIELHAAGAPNTAPTGGGPMTLRLTLQYTPAPADAAAAARGTSTAVSPAGLNESLAVILQDGKPLLISQSADPASDRRVTVEVTATILK